MNFLDGLGVGMIIELILGLVAIIASFFVLKLLVSYVYRNELPLNLNKRMLSVDEHKFLNCLERELGDEYFIMPKVRFTDFSHLDSTANFLVQRTVSNKVSNICADFVLCRKKTLGILGVVELEKFDKSITSRQKQKREKLISSMCNNMGIKLYYFDSRQDYSGIDIRRLITGRTRRISSQNKPQSSNTIDKSSMLVSVDAHSVVEDLSKTQKKRSCPKCYAEVTTKMAVKGDSIGEKFLMCRKYPYCDYKVSLKDDSIKEMEKKEHASLKKAGYNKW